MGVFGFDGVDDPDWMGGSIVVVVVGGGVVIVVVIVVHLSIFWYLH